MNNVTIISMSVWRAKKVISNMIRKGKIWEWGYQNRGKMYKIIKNKAR